MLFYWFVQVSHTVTQATLSSELVGSELKVVCDADSRQDSKLNAAVNEVEMNELHELPHLDLRWASPWSGTRCSLRRSQSRCTCLHPGWLKPRDEMEPESEVLQKKDRVGSHEVALHDSSTNTRLVSPGPLHPSVEYSHTVQL